MRILRTLNNFKNPVSVARRLISGIDFKINSRDDCCTFTLVKFSAAFDYIG
jgi:hypothetical protein